MTYVPLPDAPLWFTRALAVPQGDVEVDVDGCPITPSPTAPGHPGTGIRPRRRGARPLVEPMWPPHSPRRFRVVCVDLSGHGDSGHRPAYSLEQWTDEVMAVADVGGIAGPPVVVGTRWAAS